MNGRKTAIDGDGAQASCELAVHEGIHIRRSYRSGLFAADCSEENIEVAGIAFRRGALTIAAVEVLYEALAGLVHVGLL